MKKTNKLKRVVIIGSGFSSLTVSCYLAKVGYNVIVLEKNEQIGGRASILKKNGFTFDMGPSWYWMPDIFEKFYQDFGYTTNDFYQLKKLNPAYRVYFGKNDFIDIEDTPEKIVKTFSQIDKSCEKPLKRFLNEAEQNYQISMKDLVYQPGINITELITKETIKKLPLFVKNIASEVKKITQDERLRSILEFPVLFLGAKPQNTPAFYNFMNHADFGLGTWYPEEGMHSVVKAMQKIATELGVTFKTNEEVIEIKSNKDIANQVVTRKETYPADYVISGADYAHTDTLLGENQNYSADYWKKKTFAPSSLLYYIGFKGALQNVAHHNLFFDTDFKKHTEEIYDQPQFPENPLFYANFPSKSDKRLAPEGYSTAFFLIPTAVDLDDNAKIHQHYLNIILDRIEQNTGENLRDKIVYQKSFGVNDFKNRYHSCRGNAYGLANTLLQTSVLRPKIRNKKLKNVFYTGQLTVPGPGVPPAIISGKIVSDYIIKNTPNG